MQYIYYLYTNINIYIYYLGDNEGSINVECKSNLLLILERFNKHNIKVKIKNFQLFCQSINYCQVIVINNGPGLQFNSNIFKEYFMKRNVQV